ncbi:MAG TPA: cupredoxin domain-containing protein [Chloroflexia bacterium]|nr:cupredoxin domain-containing protein [Chloroflexia bacterium]
MNNIPWIIYGAVVLGVALVVGRYLGRFREAYTEMTGMMVGMGMGMLNGFLLGYATAAATSSMFWGNLTGMPLGVLLGAWYGRAGSLMGVLDGGMGGAMGGSMGAMLAAMLVFPAWTMNWTGLLLAALYVPGMLGLVLLIERSAPGHAAMHRLLPFFTRAISTEVREELANGTTHARPTLRIPDYYAFLGIAPDADADRIAQAYLEKLAVSSPADVRTAEVAFATLTDPHRKRAYDAVLTANRPANDKADNYPPRRKKQSAQAVASTVAPAANNNAATVRVKSRGSGQQTQQVHRSAQERPRAVERQKKEAPISWVGVTAGIVTLAVLGGWWIASQSGMLARGGNNQAAANLGTPVLGYVNNERNLPETEVRKLEAKAVTVPVTSDGKQNVDLTVIGDTMSYKPRVLKVKKGVPVHFNISVQGRDPGCGRFVAFRGLGAHGLAEPGQVTTTEFTAPATGVYEINCGREMMKPGYILVTE